MEDEQFSALEPVTLWCLHNIPRLLLSESFSALYFGNDFEKYF